MNLTIPLTWKTISAKSKHRFTSRNIVANMLHYNSIVSRKCILKRLFRHANLCILIFGFLFLTSLFQFYEDNMTKTDKQYINFSGHNVFVKCSFTKIVRNVNI